MKCLLQMKHAHSITSLLLKLFLVGCSQIFCASWAQAQYSSLSELGVVPEDSLSASPLWQQLLSDLSSSEDFEHVAWQDYEEDLEEMAQHPVNLNTATREELERTSCPHNTVWRLRHPHPLSGHTSASLPSS